MKAVMPCLNCGEELYDSITLKWDGTVPRCPRCAADQRAFTTWETYSTHALVAHVRKAKQ